LSRATKRVIQPRRKILPKRKRVACRCRARGASASVSGSSVLSGSVSSAAPPTLSNHNVATATTNHNRAARWGSLMRVRCHCQPPRFVIFKPGSIHARNPYQQASPALGARSVSNNHGSLSPSSQRASSLQLSRRAPCNAVPVPTHCVPGCGTNSRNGR
jgi:hypothetical protein